MTAGQLRPVLEVLVHRRSRTPRSGLFAAIALVVSVLVLGVSPAASADPAKPRITPAALPGHYIVTLAQNPVATYDGSVRGMAATRPRDGRRVDVRSAAAVKYQAYLRAEQTRIADRVGASPRTRYSVALNGFTADLSSAQVTKLRGTAGVLSVVKDKILTATDDHRSTDFLRLSGAGGVWAGLGGTGKAGQGVVVGVIDTGVWPESASFAGSALTDVPAGGAAPYTPYRTGSAITMVKSDGSTFTGTCVTGDQWTAADCNSKVIGARYFGTSYIAGIGGPSQLDDFVSPRDGGGHGSRTASTAAGDPDVAASIDGQSFGTITGVAPAAKIAVYKALWHAKGADTESGASSDLVQAIDAAVADGVDVINYSIGGSSESPVDDPVAQAFLSAAAAGVFVSTAAGNSGPGPSTLDNTFPWVTTVAASTIAPWYGTLALGNGAHYSGGGILGQAGVAQVRLARAVNLAKAGATAADAARCFPGTLDPAKATGAIVVCDRGVNVFIEKAAEVDRVGGVGMVVANVAGGSTDVEPVSGAAVPTVHLDLTAGNAVRTYAGGAGAKGALVPGNAAGVAEDPYPQVADFSSRGPSVTTGGDLLKPDIAAPGVAILAAVAPPSNNGHDFDFLDGTSMATPHIAGLAALFYGVGVHPKWSPMRIKSALMTTAGNTVTPTGAASTDAFAQGAGEVTPSRMFTPGLVYDSGERDWQQFVEGLGIDTGTGLAPKDPSDYNTASIAVGQLLATQTVSRTVTALTPGSYRATASVPGFATTVVPSVLSFTRAGEQRTFKVTFTRTTAPTGRAAKGFLTWSGYRTSVRSPIAITPALVDAPADVTGTGASGTASFAVRPGVAGPFPIKAYGLATATSTNHSVAVGGQQQFDFTVATGTKAVRYRATTTNPVSDVDLGVYRFEPDGSATLVGVSATESGDETVTLPVPAAGDYAALVVGYASNVSGQTTIPYVLRSFVVTTAAQTPKLTVSPANPTAVVGTPITVTAAWSGASASVPYLGWIEYADGSGTTVTVN